MWVDSLNSGLTIILLSSPNWCIQDKEPGIKLLAKLYVLDELSVDLGPEFGFALNAKAKYKDDGTTVKHKMNDINTLAVNFAIGLSYNWDDFMFSARYNLGLSNAFDKDNYNGNNKNRVFQLSVGYRLGGLF